MSTRMAGKGKEDLQGKVERRTESAGRTGERGSRGEEKNVAGKRYGGKREDGRGGKRDGGKKDIYTGGDVQDGREVRGRKETYGRKEAHDRKEAHGRKEAHDRSEARERKDVHEKKCIHQKKCGGCKYLDLTYEEQLKRKETLVRKSLENIPELKGQIRPIMGMEDPWHYRNKVTAVFSRDRNGNVISGVYEEGTHHVLPVESCLIEDELADRIIGTIRGLLRSFKIKVYDEDTGYGLLRYVLVRRGFATGQVLVVLVTASPVLPSKRNFTQALLKAHPEITTVVQNVNYRTDSMILGDRQQVLYGKGYIEDVLCGCRFRISAASFYQINPVQTEKLYRKAVELAGLSGGETVIDAYCGIGTIGLIASGHARQVTAIELNPDAVRDAIANAKCNGIRNVRFIKGDAEQILVSMAQENAEADVLFLDPPRNGSTEQFLQSAAGLGPKRIVYVSCNPVTLGRDLAVLRRLGYVCREAWPVDMFPWVGSVEVVCLLSN